MTTVPNDPRPLLRTVAAWTGAQVDAVTADQLDRPTPCSEYDVRALVGHLFAVFGRIEGISRGQRAQDLPTMLDAGEPPYGASYAERLTVALDVWADDALLDTIVHAPMGEVPGRIYLSFMQVEVLTHGWDLAVATGRDPEADPSLAAAVLATAERGVPLEGRGTPMIPFQHPVPARDGAGPTERLAAFLGRPLPSVAQ